MVLRGAKVASRSVDSGWAVRWFAGAVFLRERGMGSRGCVIKYVLMTCEARFWDTPKRGLGLRRTGYSDRQIGGLSLCSAVRSMGLTMKSRLCNLPSQPGTERVV